LIISELDIYDLVKSQVLQRQYSHNIAVSVLASK